jgi:hypothetical protein
MVPFISLTLSAMLLARNPRNMPPLEIRRSPEISLERNSDKTKEPE